ncbi:hypothetical protein H7H37_11985, partial [Mycolicibacterium insubricum]|nr:hypothetical protein [Mycolicibacterium insubricum]
MGRNPLEASISGWIASAPPETTAAAASALAAPFSVATAPLDPLPSHTGMGTSAFYY